MAIKFSFDNEAARFVENSVCACWDEHAAKRRRAIENGLSAKKARQQFPPQWDNETGCQFAGAYPPEFACTDSNGEQFSIREGLGKNGKTIPLTFCRFHAPLEAVYLEFEHLDERGKTKQQIYDNETIYAKHFDESIRRFLASSLKFTGVVFPKDITFDFKNHNVDVLNLCHAQCKNLLIRRVHMKKFYMSHTQAENIEYRDGGQDLKLQEFQAQGLICGAMDFENTAISAVHLHHAKITGEVNFLAHKLNEEQRTIQKFYAQNMQFGEAGKKTPTPEMRFSNRKLAGQIDFSNAKIYGRLRMEGMTMAHGAKFFADNDGAPLKQEFKRFQDEDDKRAFIELKRICYEKNMDKESHIFHVLALESRRAALGKKPLSSLGEYLFLNLFRYLSVYNSSIGYVVCWFLVFGSLGVAAINLLLCMPLERAITLSLRNSFLLFSPLREGDNPLSLTVILVLQGLIQIALVTQFIFTLKHKLGLKR